MIELIFCHTTTLGVREQFSRRYTMTRSIKTIKTPYGDVRKKVSIRLVVTSRESMSMKIGINCKKAGNIHSRSKADWQVTLINKKA